MCCVSLSAYLLYLLVFLPLLHAAASCPRGKGLDLPHLPQQPVDRACKPHCIATCDGHGISYFSQSFYSETDPGSCEAAPHHIISCVQQPGSWATSLDVIVRMRKTIDGLDSVMQLHRSSLSLPLELHGGLGGLASLGETARYQMPRMTHTI